MKKAVVIGLGEVTWGDRGAGSYVIEALGQEQLGFAVELADLGSRIFDLEVHLYQRDYAILVQAVTRGYPGGYVSQTAYRKPERLWWEFPGNEMRPVLRRLHLAERLGVIPPEMTFIIIEPQMVNQVLGVSKEVRLAIRKAVQLVKRNLEQRGFLPSSPVIPLRRYRLDLLRTTV